MKLWLYILGTILFISIVTANIPIVRLGVESPIDDVWVNITGDIMTGDLGMDGNDIINVTYGGFGKINITQVADDDGLSIWGFDDQDGKSMDFYFDMAGGGFINLGDNSPLTLKTSTHWMKLDSGTHIYLDLGDSAGAREVKIRDSVNADKATINSDGTAWFAGNTNVTGDLVVDTDTLFVKSSDNRVGIGTSTPLSDLSVQGTAARIGVYNDGGNIRAYPGYITGADNGAGYYYNNLNSLRVFLNSDGDSYLTGGNVGIGTNNPQGKLHVGGNPNYLKVAADGELTLIGTARVKRHYLIDPSRFKMPAANFPGESFEGISYTLDFDEGVEESAYCQEHIPFRWAAGTDIEVVVDWMHTGADAGTVVWGIEYKSIEPGETFAIPYITITQTTAAGTAANVLLRTTFTTKIIAGNLAAEDLIAMRFYRKAGDVADTLAEDARVVNVHFHFIQDKLGQAT